MAKLSPQKRQANAVRAIMRRTKTTWAVAQNIGRNMRAARGAPLSAHYVNARPHRTVQTFAAAVQAVRRDGKIVLYDSGPGREGEAIAFAEVRYRFGGDWEAKLRRAFGDQPFRLRANLRDYYDAEPESRTRVHEGTATVDTFWPDYFSLCREEIRKAYDRDGAKAHNALSLNLRLLVAYQKTKGSAPVSERRATRQRRAKKGPARI